MLSSCAVLGGFAIGAWVLLRDGFCNCDIRVTPTVSGDDINRAESLCQFFSNKIHKIATVVSQQLSCCRAVPLRHVTSRRPSTFLQRFDDVTVLEVQRMINQCPSKNSPTDFMPVWLLKSCPDEFSVIIATSLHLATRQCSNQPTELYIPQRRL